MVIALHIDWELIFRNSGLLQMFFHEHLEKCFAGNGAWTILMRGTILVKKRDFFNRSGNKTRETVFFGQISVFHLTTVGIQPSLTF